MMILKAFAVYIVFVPTIMFVFVALFTKELYIALGTDVALGICFGIGIIGFLVNVLQNLV